ncbi:MAG: DUF488 family protein [Phycisphaerales bacterium]|nr:DUF488 family protein [Phycisphaerales bacterium]
MAVAIKRIYEDRSPDDGYRVVVDALWPRGISKERAQLDVWQKEVAPSRGLKAWIHADRSLGRFSAALPRRPRRKAGAA